jgi:STE24 endopeptidase
MHFLLTLAVVAALVIAENAPGEPVLGVSDRLILAAVGIVLVPLVAAFLSIGTARQLRRHPACQSALLRQFRRLRKLHAAVWLTTAIGVLCAADWPQIVRFNWRLEGTFLLDDLLILLPVLLPLVLSWAAFYEVDREARSGPFADAAPGTVPLGPRSDVAPGGAAPAALSRGAYVAVHVRHYLGLLLVPVLLLLAVQDAMRLWLPGFREGAAVAVCGGTVLLLVIFFPVLLRYVWQTYPLPQGPLRDRLQRAARRAGLHVREILVWNTGGLVVNAAVAGMVPGLRYVFLTDGLLEHLSDDEIQAVFGHEIGHIRHGHLFLRGFALLAPLSLWLLIDQAIPQFGDRVQTWLISGGLLSQAHATVLGLAAMFLYMLALFGPFCRLLEGQADLYACRTLACEPATRPVETFVSALESLAILCGIDRGAGNWQHGSIARRVDFLKRVAQEPGRESLFLGRLRLIKGLLVAMALGPLVYRMLWLG